MFRNVYAILVFFVLSSLSAVAYGQDAQIQGQILDTTGAGIPKAIVRVVDQQTSTERRVESRDNGQYTVPGLVPGNYKIIVEAPQFTPTGSGQITLNAGQNAVYDFTLKIAATSADIVVTAEKREESLQKVPIPVSVINTDDVTEQNKVLIRDYYAEVPGLNVLPSYEDSQTLSIRGITTGAFTTPTVGITVDDVPFGASTISLNAEIVPDIDPGDLERIEVLRGPQGTLYGANSMGGLIKYVTKRPSMEGYSLRLESGASGVYNGSQPGYNFRGSSNIPLTANLAMRASAFYRHDPGYIDNVFTGQNGINEANADGGRIALLWVPSPQFSINLDALYQDVRGNGASEVDIPTAGYPQTTGLSGLEQTRIPNTGNYYTKTGNFSATLNYQFHNSQLTSVTGYNLTRNTNTIDYTNQFGAAVKAYYGVTGCQFLSHYPGETGTQEVRLDVPFHKRYDWLIGGFYSYQEAPNAYQSANAMNTTTGQIVGVYYRTFFPRKFQEYAAFTTLTVHVTDRFGIQIGGRESRTLEHDFPNVKTGPYTLISLGVPSPDIIPAIDTNNSEFNYLFSPQFNISSNFMVYGRFASGFRPGGANPNALAVPTLPLRQGPDETETYEIGSKGSFLNGKFSIDTSIFYVDWQNIQTGLRDPKTGLGYGVNGGGAKSEGVEFDIKTHPIKGLTIDGWADFDDAALTTSFPAKATAYGEPGNRLPDTSRWSANVSGEQEFLLADNMTVSLGARLEYVGDRLGPFQATAVRQTFPAYTQVDLHTAARLKSWKLNIYANNLTNERGVLDGGIGYLNPYSFIYITPRTVGFTLTRTF